MFFDKWLGGISWVEYIPCTKKTGKVLLFIMYVLFLKITRFLGLTLILHPGHTSQFFETVKIKFMGPRAESRYMGPRAEGRGPRKTNTHEKKRYCYVELLKIPLKSYNYLNVKKSTTNRSFWKTIKLILLKKTLKDGRITMTIAKCFKKILMRKRL